MSGKCQAYTSSLVKSNNETFFLCANIFPRQNDDSSRMMMNIVRKNGSSNRYRQNNPFAFMFIDSVEDV